MTDDHNGQTTGLADDEIEDMGEQVDEVTALQESNANILAALPGGLQVFMKLLEQVPEPSDDVSAKIVLEILQAQNLEDLDRPWDVEGMRDHVDSILRVKAVTRMPSDYVGGLGWYLVCQVDQPEIGEEFTLTTGSVSIVAQLVRAHCAGWLPLQVVVRKSKKPTRKGYWPMHLELVRRAGRARAVVIDQAPAEPTRQEQSRAKRQERIRQEVAQGAAGGGEQG